LRTASQKEETDTIEATALPNKNRRSFFHFFIKSIIIPVLRSFSRKEEINTIQSILSKSLLPNKNRRSFFYFFLQSIIIPVLQSFSKRGN
jgi:hypothetical protein